MNRIVLAAALAAALAAPALANDSTAELAAGGLVLTRTRAIAMRSEDLFISAEAVRVRYVFRNTTDRDVTVRVAFPMPDVGGPDFWFHDVAVPDREAQANILAFRTLVDGTPVTAEVEQKAVVEGVDRTAWLLAHHVPLAPHLDSAIATLDALPRDAQEEAVALGLATPDEYDSGRGWEKHYNPAWVLKTTFHWSQTFPAGRDVVIEHAYTPAVGGSVGAMVGSPGYSRDAEGAAERARFCIDDAFLAAVARGKGAAEYPPYTEQRIAYVLKTGGNWSEPIGDFRLVIDKGSPRNLVSFCASGVRKTGPTTFEVRKTNWRPERDLDILILRPIDAEP